MLFVRLVYESLFPGKNLADKQKPWRIKKVTNKKVQSLIGPIRDDENNIILDDVVKAEAMNDYFTAIGPTLASKINSAEGFIDMTHLY